MDTIPPKEHFETLFRSTAWLEAGARIFELSGIKIDKVSRSDQGESVVLLGDDRFVLKIYKPSRNGFERERTALESLSGNLPFAVPEIAATGEFEDYEFLMTTQLQGRFLMRAEWLKLDDKIQRELVEQLADGMKALHGLPVIDSRFDWTAFVKRNAANALNRQRAEGGNPERLESLPKFIDENLGLVQIEPPFVFLHGDVHFGNLRFVETNGQIRIAGLFDFADSLVGSHEYEFIAIGVLMIQGQGQLQRAFFRRYGYAEADINEEMRRRMMMLTILYECSSLRRYAERLSPEAVDLTLEELERAIWNFA